MKSNIKVFLLIFTVLGLMFSSCNESEDLVTKDAKTGGIVYPTRNIAYLLNATPKVSIALNVPQGNGVQSVKVYNQYIGKSDTTESNVVLMKTIDVSSSNLTEDAAKDYTLVYADLIKGLTIDGKPLPANENALPLGDEFVLTYISVLSDGREAVNNYDTKIAIANQWTGSYTMNYWALRAGDPVLTGYISDMPWKLATSGKKSVVYFKTHLWGDGKGTIGGIGPWTLTMDDSGGQTKPMPVTVKDDLNAAVKNNPAYDSRYEPSTKTFYISVFWGTGPAHRAAVDTLVYSGPF